jgi:hypothetical protein
MVDGCMQNENSYCMQGEIINPPEAGLGWTCCSPAQRKQRKEDTKPVGLLVSPIWLGSAQLTRSGPTIIFNNNII